MTANRRPLRRVPKRLQGLADTIGGLSNPAKMPCPGWSIPASRCGIGSKLRNVKGSTCSKCYALKGMYVFPNVVAALERRFSILERVLADTAERQKFITAFVDLLTGMRLDFFRWHDSGDLQSVAHLRLLTAIASRLPDVTFWLPTREYAIVRQYQDQHGPVPDNLIVRLSAHMIDGKVPNFSMATSGVHKVELPKGATLCPAYTNDGACGDCRKCWNPKVSHVSYPLH